jgi:WD40 repeat protein
VRLWFLVVFVLAGLLDGQTQFVPANYFGTNSHELRLFPKHGDAIVLKIRVPLGTVKFAGDGRSLYASLRFNPRARAEEQLMRVDFSPVRSTPIPGTQGFNIRDFAVTQDRSKIVISGRHREAALEKCGLFEFTVATGLVRQVLTDDCHYQWAWTDLTVSPDGERAVASYGNRLDLIDLPSGATKSLGDLTRPSWSPDGKWVAAIKWRKQRLILLDASDFSRRRDLGSTIEAAWSPDSKYLLVWKYHFLKCGFALDVEPPASFEVVDIKSGKRSLVRSSQCQLVAGPIGWMASDIDR